jgi:hypothetical protein
MQKSAGAFSSPSKPFAKAELICDQLINASCQIGHPLYRPLIVALHVEYGRPFKNNWGVGSLDSSIVPSKYAALHEELIIARDKILAHTDASGLKFGSNPANRVIFEITGEGARIATSHPLPRHVQVPKIRTLCIELCTLVDTEAEAILKKHRGEIVANRGTFLLDLSDSPKGFITIAP